MKLDPDIIRSRFKKHGLKTTPQRTAIYQALAQTTSHPTADDLYRRVSKTYPMISPNTVYYTLSALQKAGLIQEVNFWHDRARFDANTSPHHHVVCLACRSVQDVYLPPQPRLTNPTGMPSNFEMIRHQIVFQGYCANCQKRKGPRQDRRTLEPPSSRKCCQPSHRREA